MFKIWMDGTLNYFVENQPGQKKKKKEEETCKILLSPVCIWQNRSLTGKKKKITLIN